MRHVGVLLLLFIVLEVLSIVVAASVLGGGLTLFLMVISFVVGLFMLRNIGFSALLLAGSVLSGAANMSLYRLLWPVRFGVSGALLMSPGFLSSLFALILMLPLQGFGIFGRQTARDNVKTAAWGGFARTRSRRHAEHSPADDEVIDVTYTVVDDEPKKH